ncbi:MAG: hypothetical protein ACJ749_00560 [Flavisolibacter sp.]
MSAAAVILIQMRKCIRKFREVDATTPSTAIIPSEHGIRTSFAFRRLVREGVLIPVNPERYYLDEEREIEVRKRRQTLLAVFLVLLIIGMIVLYFTNRKS